MELYWAFWCLFGMVMTVIAVTICDRYLKKENKRDMTKDAFYRALQGAHLLFFSELRFGQFMDMFLGYMKNEKHLDPYYITDAEFVSTLKDYIKKMENKDWEV